MDPIINKNNLEKTLEQFLDSQVNFNGSKIIFEDPGESNRAGGYIPAS